MFDKLGAATGFQKNSARMIGFPQPKCKNLNYKKGFLGEEKNLLPLPLHKKL